MNRQFQLFSPVHLVILGAIPAVAFALVMLTRCHSVFARSVRLLFGGLLAANELSWYGYNIQQGSFSFPGGLPLNLCHLAAWLTVAALLTLHRWSYEMAYFIGLAGSTMAMLTPDLWGPFPSYPVIYFFLAHAGVIIGVLYLTWANLAQPRPGSAWSAFAALNVYAAAAGVFDEIFRTNYVYLCRKPEAASLLNYFGPWPVYILAGDAFALACFLLLWLPFARKGSANSILESKWKA
jgi:hypothetical integral membrane protein (TIGR02206 family)